MRRTITERELDQQDLRQVVELARARARRTYRPELGLPWVQYVEQLMSNAIRAHTRQGRRAKPKGVRFVRIEGMRKPLVARESRPEFGGALVLFEAAAAAMELLSPAEKRVVLLMFHMDMTRQEAATQMGKSPEAVEKLRERAIERLRLSVEDPAGS